MASKQPIKPWYESSTIWLNVLGIAVTGAELALASNLIPDPEYIALVIALVNIANRFRAPKTVSKLSR